MKSLIGYDDHDPTKSRGPAYSMKFRHPQIYKFVPPAPYKIQDGLTHKGPYSSPAQTMQFKPRSLSKFKK